MGKARQAIAGRGRVSLPRGGAARFASEVFLRHGGGEAADWYPEAWLALREEGERFGDRRLNRFTLKLLLQINEYLAAPEGAGPSRMEYHAVLGALAASLRTLEARGGMPAKEIRLLVGRLSALERAGASAQSREENVRRAREELTRWLSRGDAPAPPVPSASAAPVSHAPRREGGKGGGETGAVSPHWDAAAWDGRFPAFPASGSGEGPRREGPAGPVLFQAASAARRQASRLAGVESQGISALPGFALPSPALSRRLVREKVTALLLGGDRREREEIWHVLERQRWLIDRHPEVFGREVGPLESRLEHVVWRCTDKELFRLRRVLERALTQPPSVSERGALAEPPPAGEDPLPDRGREARLEQASPALEWLGRALERGRVRREDLLRLLAKAPPAARLAFLTLAEESGAFSKAPRSKAEGGTQRGWNDAQDPDRRLTLLVRESSRHQLERLLRWTREEDRRARAAQTEARTVRLAQGAGDARRADGSREETRTAEVQKRRSRLFRELQTLLPAAPAQAGQGPVSPAFSPEGTGRPRPDVLRPWEERRITYISRRSVPEGSRAAAQSQAAGAPPAQGERRPFPADPQAAGQTGPRPMRRETGPLQTALTPDVAKGAAKPPTLRGRPPKSPALGLLPPVPAAAAPRFAGRLPKGLLGRELLHPTRPAAADKGAADPRRPVTPRENRPRAPQGAAPEGKGAVPFGVPPALRRPFFQEGLGAGPVQRPPLLAVLQNFRAMVHGKAPFPGWAAGGERDPSAPLPAARREESGETGAAPPAAFPLILVRPVWEAALAREAAHIRDGESPPGNRRAPALAERSGDRGMAPLSASRRRGGPPVREKAGSGPAPWDRAPFAVRRQASPARLPPPGGEQAPQSYAGAPKEHISPPVRRGAGAAWTKRETGALLHGTIRPSGAARLPQAAWKARLPESGRGAFTASRPEAELALLRPSGPRQAAAQAAEETAVRQEAPELKLLRRQAGEQAERIARQQESMSGLKDQLQRQEQLLRQALEQKTPAEEAGQVRKLTRAVMAEMEKQLRLERQRRGLS